MNKVFIFVLGAAAGSLVTWKIVEEKYKRLADEEIAGVVEYYKNKEEAKEHIVECKAFEEKIEEPNMSFEEYKNKVEDLGYSNNEESDDVCIAVTENAVEFIAPYIIAPEEFGEFDEHNTKSWTLYEDGVLADESDEIVVDPENIIGDALEHFGEYEEDSVYVRNENTECDYEILKSEKTFKEVSKEDI